MGSERNSGGSWESKRIKKDQLVQREDIENCFRNKLEVWKATWNKIRNQSIFSHHTHGAINCLA